MIPLSPFSRLFPRRTTRLVASCVAAAALLGSCATVSKERSAAVDTSGQAAISPTLLATGPTLKRKVVIARFTNESLYGKSVLLGDNADLIGRQASDILATRIAESGQFLLFERTDPTPILEALDAGTIGELGLPADFLIIGSVSEFGRDTRSKTGVFSRTLLQRARARVNVRLVDVRSSRVIFAQEGAGEAESEVGTVVGIGTKADYDSTLNDQAISAAISKLVNNLFENLLDQPWVSYVLSVEGETVLIGGGASQGIAVGERFKVLERGKEVLNPQTGTTIELPGTQVAVVQVDKLFGTDPETEYAQCRLLSGEIAGDDLAQYIVHGDEE